MEQSLYELPEGWEWKSLQELYDIARGGSPRPIKKYITTNEDGVNWIKIGDATASSKYIYQTKEKITVDGVKKSRMVNDGDFILSNSMSFGRPYIMKTSGCIHDGWLVLKPQTDAVFQDYAYHALSAPVTYRQFDNAASGSTVRNLNSDLVRKVRIPLPPLNEQKRIVSRLDALFTRIDAAITHLQETLELSKALFASALDARYEELRGEFERKDIKSIVQVISGYAFKSGDFSDSGTIRSVKITNVGLSEFVETEGGYLPDSFSDKYERFAVNAGDIVIALTRSIINGGLKACRVTERYEGALVNQRVAALAGPLENGSLDFVYWYLKTSIVFNYVLEKSRSLNQPNFSIKDLNQLAIPWPSLSEQEKTVAYIKALSEHTCTLEAETQVRLDQLATLKSSLLDAAFRGQL